MVTKKKTCFVISPIGDPGSDTRRDADELYDYILEPAMQKYSGFELVRSDRMPARPTPISADVITLVQNAELCIVDLTGNNPNVLYECGRRHETGKPVAHLVRQGGTLPFDFIGLRVIRYTAATPKDCRDAVLEIQKYVDDLEAAGYESSTGATIGSISLALARVEARLSQIAMQGVGTTQSQPAGGDMSDGGLKSIMMDPYEAFLRAVAVGDLSTAAATLPRIEQRGDVQATAQSAALIASAGIRAGAEALDKILKSGAQDLDGDTRKLVVGGLSRYYSRAGGEELKSKGLPLLRPVIEDVLRDRQQSDDDRAFWLNQLGMLEYGAGNYEAALDQHMKACELKPSVVPYIYNASIVFEKLGRLPDAAQYVDRYINVAPEDLDQVDADHLSHAVEIYVAAGRSADARRAIARLQTKDPTKAKMMLMLDKIRKAVRA